MAGERTSDAGRTDATEGSDEGEERRTSVWLDSSERTDYPPLDGRGEVDTAVVGGGIAGLTTAFELVEAGQSVAVIERDRIVEGTTGYTSAKLTSLHGLIYDHLLDHFGEQEARQYARANESAIDAVESRVETYDIDCDFERTPAYTYTESTDEVGKIREEVEAARQLDLPATYIDSTSLPYDVAGAVRFDDQARFHPRNYLLALAREIDDAESSHVFERTRATDVSGGRHPQVSTDRGTVLADDVVVATNFPIHDRALYFARMYPKRSYVLDLRLEGAVPEGMYYLPEEPYFSVRPHPAGEGERVLVGGQNHRTGHGGDTSERYRKLERRARERFDVESVENRWSTQDVTSVDEVPLVGQHSPLSNHVYLATGFGGWGMTNGTAAGTVLADRILDRPSPWNDVFRPTRFDLGASKRDLLEHNTHAMSHFFADHLGLSPTVDVSDIDRGEGDIVDADGDPVGVYHDEDGEYHAVSAVCPHMGCHVEWNDGERSWDCPCHGSRFGYDGSVIDTPAVDDLERYDDRELTLRD
jgi:glycine/D-amino acid oxidase-like deaminating enzyme/nitrite reductase/ring-hydroxylating ferredoxin subunit